MVKLTSLEGKTKLALCFFFLLISWRAKMQFARREKEMGLNLEAMLSGLVALQYVRWLGWPEQDLSKAKGLEWSPALFCLSCDERIIPSSSLQLKEWLFFRKRRRQAFFTQWWTSIFLLKLHIWWWLAALPLFFDSFQSSIRYSSDQRVTCMKTRRKTMFSGWLPHFQSEKQNLKYRACTFSWTWRSANQRRRLSTCAARGLLVSPWILPGSLLDGCC